MKLPIFYLVDNLILINYCLSINECSNCQFYKIKGLFNVSCCITGHHKDIIDNSFLKKEAKYYLTHLKEAGSIRKFRYAFSVINRILYNWKD